MDINIVVKTEVITYSVDYDQKDGVVDIPLITHYTVNDEFTLPALTKNGYTFTGWTLEGSPAEPNTNYKVTKGTTGNLKFIANFEAINYSITYNDAEMEKDSVKSYTIETNDFTLPEPKAKTGYTFEGWKENVSDAPDKNLTITKGSTGDKIFTASWKANTYKITFETADCGGYLDPSGQSLTMEVTYDQPYSNYQLVTMARPGYTFDGWYTSKTGGSKIGEGQVKITENIKVYPHWTARNDTKYTVYYYLENLAGGWNLIDQQGFIGTTDTQVEPSVTPKKDIDLTGFKTPERQTITIDGNGESSCRYNYYRNSYNVALTDKRSDGDTTKDTGVKSLKGAASYKYGSTVTLSVELKPGYEIAEWKCESSDKNIKINADDSQTRSFNMPANNVNFTVITKPINYSIHLSQGSISSWNGLSDPQKPFTFENKLDLPIPSNNEISNGCTFAGWYYKDDKTERKIENEKNLIDILSSLNTREITLTAKWKKTYTVECTLENLSGDDITYKYEDIVGFLGEPVLSAQELANKIASKNNDSTMFEGYVIPTDDPQKLSEETTKVTYNFSLKRFNVTFKTNGHISSAKCLVETAKNENEKEQPVFANNETETTLEFRYGEKIKLRAVLEKGYDLANFGEVAAQSDIFENGEPIYVESQDWTVTKNSAYKFNTQEKVYKINCNAGTDGYFGLDEKNNKITSQGYDYKISYEDIILPVPKRDGYRFKGYKLEHSNSNELYTVVSKGSTGNLNFVAQWEKDSSTYNVYLECKRDYHEDHFSGNTILITRLTTYQLKDGPFQITLTSTHQHGDHKIVKWRRYYSDTQYSEYENGRTITIDPSMEKEDIYFVAVYDDGK